MGIKFQYVVQDFHLSSQIIVKMSWLFIGNSAAAGLPFQLDFVSKLNSTALGQNVFLTLVFL